MDAPAAGGARVPRRHTPVGETPGAAPWSTADHPERDLLRAPQARTTEVPRHEGPAMTPGTYWIVAAVGIGLLCMARLILFFAVMDDLPDDTVAAALFAVLGIIALAAGLTLAALLQHSLSVPWRIALLLGGGYFAFHSLAAGILV